MSFQQFGIIAKNHFSVKKKQKEKGGTANLSVTFIRDKWVPTAP